MMNFTLPFGAFQIHFAKSTVVNAVRPLQEALEEWDTLVEAAFGGNAEDLQVQSGALDNIAEGFSIQRLKGASEKFKQSLEISEFPEVLPRITAKLIFAPIVAQTFHLSFEVVDYELNVNGKGRSYWWVTGRIIGKRGRANERLGTSFMFDKDNDKMAEGALLSACADAFVHCVYAIIPYFPWDRHFPWAGEPHIK